jgi:uroporphyrinogen decarboxylase
VRFLEGEGPRLEPATTAAHLEAVPLERQFARLAPVGETVERVRAQLDPGVTLIGFAGSPWTVAVYAIEGRGGTDKSDARRFGFQFPDELRAMLDVICESSAHYLAMQVRAGADALMLFDSWAEGLDEVAFGAWVIEPTRRLVQRVRELGVTAPILGFPRGCGAHLADYAARSGVDAVGLDTAQPLAWVDRQLPPGFPVQGNLDPQRLVSGGKALDQHVRGIVAALKARPHVFNLGHGVVPETPIAHVERTLTVLRSLA